MQTSVILLVSAILFIAQPTAVSGGYSCATGTCANGGTCSNFGGTPFCNCVTGFHGAQCEYSLVTDCWGNSAPDVWVGDKVCNKGDILFSGNFISFNCAAFDYDGGDCATPTTPNNHGACTPNPCGTGKCFGSDTKHWCSCPRNAAGADCQSAVVTLCASAKPCLNGGRCIDDISETNNYLCVCPSGYTDVNCSTAIPHVTPSDPTCTPSCDHGICYATNTCFCYSGYYGATCSNVNTACDSNPCQNGATCAKSTGANTYRCTCASGYTGTNCQTGIAPCLPNNPCVNGGKCGTGSPYSCTCAAGYDGINCTFAATGWECDDFFPGNNKIPSSFLGDGICENKYTYISASSSVERFSLVDCPSPRGDTAGECQSELTGSAARASLTVALLVAMFASFFVL